MQLPEGVTDPMVQLFGCSLRKGFVVGSRQGEMDQWHIKITYTEKNGVENLGVKYHPLILPHH